MRQFIRSTPGFALVIVLAACADQVTAPGSVQPDATVSEKITVDYMAADRQSADFTVTGTGGWFRLGRLALYIPKHAICDPRTSGYGPAEWDKPCEVLKSPIQMHAEILTIDGAEVVHFTPALRFVPSRNPSKWVWIFMKVGAIDSRRDARNARILWTPAVGATGIDESLTDPTLATRYDDETESVYRRIKHFSGYQVSVGFTAGDDEHGSEY